MISVFELDVSYSLSGDIVDRGFFSVEILLIILMALITNPNAVFINRGNQ